MTDHALTAEEEQKVFEGQAAASLLDSPAYLLAIERIRSQCAESILTSAPGNTLEREELYTLTRGLSAVTQELIQMQSEGQVIADNAARPIPDIETLGQDDLDDADY